MGARPLGRSEYAGQSQVGAVAAELPGSLARAEAALEAAPVKVFDEVSQLANGFLARTAEELFDAVLARHAQVQRQKPPEGKREWFEQARDGSVIVRTPYRLEEQPSLPDAWARPYRLRAVWTFCNDLKMAME
jgi:hypothetical protein